MDALRNTRLVKWAYANPLTTSYVSAVGVIAALFEVIH